MARQLPTRKNKSKRKKSTKKSKSSLKLREKIQSKLDNTEEEDQLPRITNETVAEQREIVLEGGKRFKYPLQHSKYKVVIISVALILLLLISFLTSSWMILYRRGSTSDYAYRISRIVPFPVAKVDGRYVSFEDYLFDLRSTVHFLRTQPQEGVDIDSEEGAELLKDQKRRTLDKIKLDALAIKLADENGIKITDEEVDAQVRIIQEQGGIAESDEVFEDVLRDSYDWDLNDLKRAVRVQLIRQKLPKVLDTEAVSQAERALAELKSGEKFADVAEKYSDDNLTKNRGGLLGQISKTNTDLPSEYVDAAFNLRPRAYTQELVETSVGLFIIRNNKTIESDVEVSHILIRYFDIEKFLGDRLAEIEVVDYLEI